MDLIHKKLQASALWGKLDNLRGHHRIESFAKVVLFILVLRKQGIRVGDNEAKSSTGFIEKLKLKKQDALTALLGSIEPILLEMANNNILNEIGYAIEEITHDVSVNEYAALFDEILINYMGRQSKEFSFLYQTPSGLADFITSIIYRRENITVFNPFAGVASFALGSGHSFTYTGEEINPDILLFGSLRLLAYNLEENAVLENKTSFNWKTNDKYDAIMAFPPFGIKHEGKSVNSFLLEHGYSSLKTDGQMVLLLSHSALYETSTKEKLVEICAANELEAIISLPSGAFSFTAVKSCIVVINKDKQLKGKTKLIDASSLIKNKQSGHSAFDQEALSLLFHADIETDVSLIVSDEDIYRSALLDPAQVIFKREANNIPYRTAIKVVAEANKNFLKAAEGAPYKKITPAHLNNNIRLLYDRINPDTIKSGDILLDKSCFLIHAFNGQLKFSYFEYSGEPYISSKSVIPIVLDESRITLSYFAKQLLEKRTTDQIKIHAKGSGLQHVNITDFLNIVISVPSMTEQNKMDDSIRMFFHTKDKNLDIIESLEDKIFEKNTYLRHSIAAPIQNISTFFQKLTSLLEVSPEVQVKDLMQKKLRPNDRYSFKDMMEIITRDFDKVKNVVRNQLSAETTIQSAKLAPLDIDAFLEDYVAMLKMANPEVKIGYDSFVPYLLEEVVKDDFVTILGNAELLTAMLDNLFDNAKKHAFTEGDQHKFAIELTYDEDSGKLTIDVANSGKPLQKDLTPETYTSKSWKSGRNAGSGYGGWYINEIIKRHKGELSIEDNTIWKEEIHNGYITSFIIELPLINS